MNGRKKQMVLGRLATIGLLFFFLTGSLTLVCAQGGASSQKKAARVIPPESTKIGALRKAMDVEIDAFSARMIEMIDWMYKNPESGYEEFMAAEMLTAELKKNGFEVQVGVPGLDPGFDREKFLGGLRADYSGPSGFPTAFKANYKGKTDHPAVGFMVEYDALRGNPPYHGCQHNMQAPTGMGAAIALAKVMERNNIPGSVWVIGTPAEEVTPQSKAVQAKAGYLNGIDFIMTSHGTPTATLRSPGGFSSMHLQAMNYTFHGKPAHGASAWGGLSALDGVMLLFHGIDMLREHSEPQFRFHGIVSEGGTAPNIVPEKATANFWARHLIDETPVGNVTPMKARKMFEAKVAQVDNIAKGSALATGTTVDIDHFGACVPGISVGTLNDIAFQYAVDYGGIKVGESAMPGMWDDTGFASLLFPGVGVGIAVEGIPEATSHSQENANITISPAGHKSAVLTSKVMAASYLRLVMDPALQKKAKEEHAMWAKKYQE